MRINSSLKSLVFLLMILLTSLACVVNGESPADNANLAATQEALVQTQVALSVQQTLQAQGSPTLEASAVPQEINTVSPMQEDPCAGKSLVNSQGVSFCYEPSLAGSVTNEVVPAIVSEMSENFHEPEHNKFMFQGYAISPTFHAPVMHIYPVAGYIAINPYAAQGVEELQAALQSQSSNLSHMPFMPKWNAAQMMHTQVSYLSFQNGQGVRYLTQYGQAFWPVNNEDLFYTFQGLTNDGQYYISAILPVSNPVLPANGEAYPGDINSMGDTYQTYIADINSQLNAQPAESYLPQLNHLDAMMQSLLVSP
jgi:hypothetical protein